MDKCKSCGAPFNSNADIRYDVDSEQMFEEIMDASESGDNCPECIFDTAFYNESIRQFRDHKCGECFERCNCDGLEDCEGCSDCSAVNEDPIYEKQNEK